MLSRVWSSRSLSRLTPARLSLFDCTAKLKDSSASVSSPDKLPLSDKKRKPSDRVIRLTDEILNLSLIEAADLCDLCSERLGGSRPAFFPMMGNFQSAPPAAGVAAPAPAAPVAAPAPASAPSSTTATPAASASPAKTTVSIKLVSFDAAKKVQTVKEVRAMTALGLKEAKDAVEAAPKILKKGVPISEANTWKKKLEEECGAKVELE